MDKRAPQNGCFFHLFCYVYKYPCCCCFCGLTLPQSPMGSEVIGYDSDPLPSDRWIRHRFHKIIFTLKYSLGYSSLVQSLYPATS